MKYLIIIFIAVIIGIGVFVFFGRLIQIDSITCTSQFGKCRQGIVDDLEKAVPDNYGRVKKNIRTALDANSYVNEYSFKLILSGKIKVDVLEADPGFAIKSGGSYALVDDEGVVVAIVEKTDLLYVVVFDQVPNVGDVVGDKELFSLKLIEKLFNTRGVSVANLADNKLKVVLPEGISVIFPTRGNVDDLAATLDILMFKLNNGQLDLRIEDIGEIDLRYKNPVFR